MNSRLITYVIVLGVIAMALVFFLPYSGLQFSQSTEKFISPNQIKSIEVFSKGNAYPLNFDQQNQVVKILNRSVFVEPEAYFQTEEISFYYDKVVIYPIEGSPVELTPVGILHQQLILKAPSWNPNGYIRETGPGELNPLLNGTFDH